MSIRINNKSYSKKEILSLSQSFLLDSALPNWEKEIANFLLEWFDEKDFVIVKTSGSTGEPKEIKLLKSQMIKSAQMTGQFLNLNKNDNALLCLPVKYIAGKMMIVRTIVLGLNLITVEPNSNPLASIKTDKKIHFAAFIPLQLINSLNQIEILNQIEKLIVGGAEFPENLKDKVQSLQTEIFETYGMTETATHVALKRINGANKQDFFQALDGIEVETDERNCLIINAKKAFDETFVTNDIVELKSKTEFKLSGRYDNVINSGGIKISPEILESKIKLFLNENFIISSIKDEKLGEKLVLLLERKTIDNQEKENIFAKLKKVLNKNEVPKEIYCLENFPRTENGKIKRKELQNMIS
ncbi:MAG: AMP-binding protein [Saprospiraceae bacterium]|nr:AMP-binding protein [Saprospiraceae bacterium]